jgi:hypothetical protein
MFTALGTLEDRGIIIRTVDKRGYGTIELNAQWKPDMLNLPKRLKDGAHGAPAKCTPCTDIAHPVHPVESNPEKGIPEKDNPFGSLEARPVPNPAARVRGAITSAVAAHRTAVTAKVAKTSSAATSIGVEAAWKAAMLDAFPHSIHKPWSIREKAQVKQQVKVWLHATQIAFPAFVDWAVRNWSGIIAKQFKWMTKSPPPAVPSLPFLLSFLGQFTECWSEGKLDEWLKSSERTEMEKLLASGMSTDEATAEIGRRRAIEGMREENQKVRAEAASKLRRAERVERRTGNVMPIHPQSLAAKRARGEVPAAPRIMSGDEPQIDWASQPTFDPNWEPPE